MLLDLKSIIEIPGEEIGFDCYLDVAELDFSQIVRFITPPRAVGTVKNSAGALTLSAKLGVEMACLCDRCGSEFEYFKKQDVSVALAESPEDDENPDIFLVEGDWVDVGEILRTCFVLEFEPKFLCSEDCAGLCETCGKNLNDDPCNCDKNDPRLASLRQLLDELD